MNIADSLRASASRLPDKPALIFQGAGISYAQLDARADATAALLQSCGLRPGDRLALLLGNVPAFVEAFYGALRAGLVVVPINVGSTTAEIGHLLSDSGARAAVVASSAAPAFAAVRAGVREAVETVFEVGGAAGGPDRLHSADSADGAEVRAWHHAIDGAAGTFPEPVELPTLAHGQPPDEQAPAGLALLGYTSGSTGKPKGAKLSHANLLANQRQMARTLLQIDERDVVLCALPLFHIYALNVGMAYALARGATVLLVERFAAPDTLALIAAQRASVIVGAPPMYVAWMSTPGWDGYDLASVRTAVSGAAALPTAAFERFRDAFGIPIWEGYGLTETAPVLTSTAMGTTPVPGSVGRPLPEVEVRLLDDAGQPVRRGDPGEVVVRGPNVFSGYWRQPAATAEVLDADGWFRTGDIGYVDGGNLYLVDRKKDLIVVSGFNVYPREVEDVLHTHPKVAEAAVIGVPQASTGEAVKAVVVLRPGERADAEELIGHCRTSLARFKCPVVVEFAAELPHLPSGKLKRRELRGVG